MDVIVVVMDGSDGPVKAEAFPSMFDPPRVVPAKEQLWFLDLNSWRSICSLFRYIICRNRFYLYTIHICEFPPEHLKMPGHARTTARISNGGANHQRATEPKLLCWCLVELVNTFTTQ